jgi:hypothetical protein
MRMSVLLGSAAILGTLSAASADPVGLDAYVDANGFIDVQTLTCAQLANTYQEDANALTSWYSGPRAQALSRLPQGSGSRASGDRVLQGTSA